MLCARVIRGISSIDSIDTPVAATSRIACGRSERIGEPDDRLTGVQTVGGWGGADLEEDVATTSASARETTVAPCAV